MAPYRHLLINLVRTAPEQQERALIADSIARSEALFSILDAELATQTWLGGAKFGVADIALGPTIYALFNLDISWAAHENLRRWYQQLTQRPAYQKVVMIPVT